MPWKLERALICRQYDWRWTPSELDGMDPAELKEARDLLGVWDTMRQRASSIKGMTADQVELAGRVDRLRDLQKQAGAGS